MTILQDRCAISTVHPITSKLGAIVGQKHVLTDVADMGAYLADPRDLLHGRAICVVRPASTGEVAAVLKLCAESCIGVVPQGGNTGLVGGQIPGQGSRAEVVLSLKRMDRLREIDVSSNTMTVEAGMTLQRAQDEADKIDRLFPLSLASEGSCTVGGNLATNAGGTAVLAYGNARDLALGLEIVLADGRVLSNLSKLRKDNTGYDLKHLFIGSEGTLGVITAAVLKLFPRERTRATAFCGMIDPHKATALFEYAQQRAGGTIKAFEIIPRFGVEFVLRHGHDIRDPFDKPHRWYVLVEMTSTQEDDLENLMVDLLETALERGIIEDAAIATSLEQRGHFWRLRELLSELQKLEGALLKHDVSVPLAKMPLFIETVTQAIEDQVPGARICAFGHMGDGNIHYNVSQPAGGDKQAFLDHGGQTSKIVHELVMQLGGSISAEHGIGTTKRDLLCRVKDPVAFDVMRTIKSVLDPKNILNPGKVL